MIIMLMIASMGRNPLTVSMMSSDVKASKPRDRIVTMHMTATSVTFQMEMVLAQVYRMKLEEDQSENVVLLFMQLKHML